MTAQSSPCLQGKLAKAAVPWIIFQFAPNCFSLIFMHALLRQNIIWRTSFESLDDDSDDHILLASSKNKTMIFHHLYHFPSFSVIFHYKTPQPYFDTATRCSPVADWNSSQAPTHWAASARRTRPAEGRCWRTATANASPEIGWCHWPQNTWSSNDPNRWPNRWPKNPNTNIVCVWEKQQCICKIHTHSYKDANSVISLSLHRHLCVCVIRCIRYNVCVSVRVHIILQYFMCVRVLADDLRNVSILWLWMIN